MTHSRPPMLCFRILKTASASCAWCTRGCNIQFLGFFSVICRRDILLHRDLRQATWWVIGPLTSLCVGSFGLSLSLHFLQGNDKHVPVRVIGKKTRSFSMIKSLDLVTGLCVSFILITWRKRATRGLGNGKKRGWMPFLSRHLFSKTLEHELAFDVNSTFHQFKIQHAGFLLCQSLQCSAPSRSVSAALENDLG